MPLKEAAVVVNPVSASGITERRWPEIAAALEQEKLSFIYSFTEAPGHATDLTRGFLQEGYDLIIAVGGDGTVNEVTNGFFHNGEAVRESAALGYVSTGTGGDLGRTIGIRSDPIEAIRHIKKSQPRPVDLGKVIFINNQGLEETRYFINVAGLGLDGDTVARVNRTSKVLGGFISFLWGTVVSLLLYQNQNMIIYVDGELVTDEPVTVVVIGNGCYFGGGMKIAPYALLDDGFFDIVILRDLSRINLLLNLPRVYRGTHLSHPRITNLRGKEIKVTAGGTVLLNLDGEQPGRAPAEIKLIPRALNLRG